MLYIYKTERLRVVFFFFFFFMLSKFNSILVYLPEFGLNLNNVHANIQPLRSEIVCR